MGNNGKNWNHEKLIGQKINRLLVESIDRKNSRDARIYYVCRCDCGQRTSVRKDALTTKERYSCGCFQIEQASIGKKRLPPGERAKRNQFGKYRQGARKRKLEFKISYKKFCELTKLNCFYCGGAPYKRWNVHGGDFCISNGLDRIDSSKGYIETNVVSCCQKCNTAKSSMTIEEFKNHIKLIYNNLFNEKPYES